MNVRLFSKISIKESCRKGKTYQEPWTKCNLGWFGCIIADPLVSQSAGTHFSWILFIIVHELDNTRVFDTSIAVLIFDVLVSFRRAVKDLVLN